MARWDQDVGPGWGGWDVEPWLQRAGGTPLRDGLSAWHGTEAVCDFGHHKHMQRLCHGLMKWTDLRDILQETSIFTGKKNCSCCVFPLKPAQYWSKVFPIRFCHGFSTIEACSRTLPGWLTWTLGILLSAFCHHLNMLHVGFLAKKTPTAGSWAAMTNTIWLVRSICSIKCDRFLLKLWVFSFNVWTPCNSYESTPSHNCGNDRPWTCS